MECDHFPEVSCERCEASSGLVWLESVQVRMPDAQNKYFH